MWLYPRAKKRKHKKGDKEDVAKVDEDCMRHGGWWRVTAAEEITGSIAIEFGRNTYVSALDNGLVFYLISAKSTIA